MSSHNRLFDVPEERGPEEKALFTSVIDGEFPDLCPKTGVLFLLTVLPPQPP
jgi:hypothetical protein